MAGESKNNKRRQLKIPHRGLAFIEGDKTQQYPIRIERRKSPSKDFLLKAQQGDIGSDELKYLHQNTFTVNPDDTIEINEKHQKQIEEWLDLWKHGPAQARDLYSKLQSVMQHNGEGENRSKYKRKLNNLTNALLECATQNIDPKMDFLYGAIWDLWHDDETFLDEYISIKNIYAKAKELGIKKERERSAKRFMNGIQKLFQHFDVNIDAKVYKILTEENLKK
jgi:hypothetical protein